MTTSKTSRVAAIRPALRLSALFAATTLALSGCGSGGDDTPPAPQPPPPPPSSTTLSGVVASGAAVPGASVVIKDADGATADVSATAGTNGSYSADVGSLRAPLLVTATGTLNGEAVSMAAVVPSVTAAAGNTANVTPLTNAVAALVAPSGNVAALADPAALAAAATATNVSNASQLVVNTLRTDAATNTALGASFDPLSTAFTANGTGVDGVLDSLEVTTSAAGVTITNLAAPVSASGLQSVTLTPAQTATPTVVPTLPASAAAGALPTTSEMTALAAKYEACLAEPLATRVTLDANGRATALSAGCNFAPANWRSAGLNWVERLGSFTFSRESLSGATAGTPVIAAVLPPANRSGNEFQHPMCNTDTCVVMRIPMTSASGQPFSSDFQLGKINGQWDYVGNQVPYAIGVELRINRKTQVNTALAAANPTNYFAGDRIEAVARLNFDSSIGTASQVRTIRWTGPGLPAAGVVTVRSQRCMTVDRFAITNQEGVLDVNNQPGTRQWWTGGSAADFVFSASRLDGSAIVTPVPSGNWASNTAPANQDFSAAPVTAAIPAWSEYRAEVFYFTNDSTVPDEVIHARNNSPYEQASQVAGIAWPTLAQATIDAYLKPTGANAGRITDLTHSLAFTNPAGNYVSGGYLFSQNRISTTNAENETANYWLRGSITMRPTAFGDATVSGKEWNDARNGTSLSPSTASTGTNPNPRCGSQELVALEGDATNLSYREIGLGFRGAGSKLYQDIHFWSN
jgi:hypothetical protein